MRPITLILLLLALALPLAAQTTTTTTTTETAPAVANDARPSSSPHEIRELFSSRLRDSSPELTTILTADPSLLADDAFLARYPDIAKFVAQYPEVRRNPRFYLVEFDQPQHRRTIFDEILDMIGAGFVFIVIVSASVWLIRTVIEQRRWSRLSKTQAEVHTKILDRFGTSAEVLEYIKTPAGTKFLESAPIPLHTEAPMRNTPMARIIWSIQIGVIIAAAAIGMLVVSARFTGEAGSGMFAMGVIAFSIGVGFVASAGVSLFVSRKLGVLESPPQSDAAGLSR